MEDHKMRKHRILAGILAVALVLSLGGVNIFAATGSPIADAAEVPVPEGYCEQDYLKLYAFLEMADADGVKNGTKLNEDYDPTDPTTWGTTNENYDPEDPTTWRTGQNITWRELTTGEGEDEVTVRYLLIFNAPASDLCGQLDLSGCKFLREVYVQNNTLTQVDVSESAIQQLDCSGNRLTELNVSGCGFLTNLVCDNNQLTALALADCNRLAIVDCSGNQLTALDFSATNALTTLNCENNRLSALTFNNMSYPIHVDCSGNQLTDLNTYVMQYTQDLDCSDNLFTSLDVRSCGMLETFSCQGNKLEKLDLSSNGKCHARRLTAVGEGYVGYAMERKEDGATTYTAVATPVEGSVFQGWYTNRDCTTLVTTNSTIDVTEIAPADAKDYYAKFDEGGGAVEVPKGYNVNDYLKLRTFLEQTDEEGVKNGFKLNEDYTPDDVTTWGVCYKAKRPHYWPGS